MRKLSEIGSVLLVMMAVALFSGCPSNSGGGGEPYLWEDDFNGTTIDTTKWRIDANQGGGFGNSEPQIYRTQNAYITNDGTNRVLAIKLEKSGSTYYSARLCTLGKTNFQYRTVSARIKVPKGNAVWPAFWMIGEKGGSSYTTPTTINTSTGSFNGWPYCGEIDIMEFRGDQPTKVLGTLHWNESATTYDHASYGTSKISTDYSLDYHIYSMTWDTSTLKIAVDGVDYFTMSISADTKSEFQQPFFIILNLAMGSASTGFTGGLTINDAELPKYMYVDWVKVQ